MTGALTDPAWVTPVEREPVALGGRIRVQPADFQVDEIPLVRPAGRGDYVLFQIEKQEMSTFDAILRVSKGAKVSEQRVGYAGLKDRRAVTTQWFSLPLETADPEALGESLPPPLELTEWQRARHAVRRGGLRANRFTIRLRRLAVDPDTLAARLNALRSGIPNYFGEQRFGRDGNNVSLADAWASGKRLPRHKRSVAISTARSLMFNEQLDARVRAATWNTIVSGDRANLDGTGSVFNVEEVDDEIRRRCNEMDIHPAGELPGDGSNGTNERWIAALGKARVEAGTRSLRLRVSDLTCKIGEDAFELEFTLGRGAFATSVLREIVVSCESRNQCG